MVRYRKVEILQCWEENRSVGFWFYPLADTERAQTSERERIKAQEEERREKLFGMTKNTLSDSCPNLCVLLLGFEILKRYKKIYIF